MSYSQLPKKTGLPREFWKWLQSLELSFYPKNVRRDFSSGYIVAEIFSRYYPHDFSVHSYDKGTSLTAKQSNWSLIKRSLRKHKVHLMKEVIEAAIHCKPGAAELLAQDIYTLLTNRSIRSIPGPGFDFTDQQYQDLLPTVARSTASQAIKVNIKNTEVVSEPDICTNQRKAKVIIHRHEEQRATERRLSPVRGHCKGKSTPGQVAAMNHGPSSCAETASMLCSSSTWSGLGVPFKEIKVRQPIRRGVLNF